MTQWNVLSLRAQTMVVNEQLNKSKAHSLLITYLHVDGDFKIFFDIYTAELQIITQLLFRE